MTNSLSIPAKEQTVGIKKSDKKESSQTAVALTENGHRKTVKFFSKSQSCALEMRGRHSERLLSLSDISPRRVSWSTLTKMA